VHHLWSLGCSSYLHPFQGHSIILMRFQQSDPTFNMGVNVTRPAFDLEPSYRVTMLGRELWTRGPGTSPVKRAHLVYRWVQEEEGHWGWSLWATCGKKAQNFTRKVCYSFTG
jgi:hypothetical protein